jgi:hypothetical protein
MTEIHLENCFEAPCKDPRSAATHSAYERDDGDCRPRSATRLTPAELGTFEMGCTELGILQKRRADVGTFEVRFVEVGALERRPTEVGAFEMRSAQVGAPQNSLPETKNLLVPGFQSAMRLATPPHRRDKPVRMV